MPKMPAAVKARLAKKGAKGKSSAKTTSKGRKLPPAFVARMGKGKKKK